MIEAILIDGELSALQALEGKISRFCPDVSIKGRAQTISSAHKLALEQNPDLLFIDPNMPSHTVLEVLQKLPPLDCEFIIVTKMRDFAVEAIKFCTSGYILKPVGEKELKCAVRNVQKKIMLREAASRNQQFISELVRQLSANDLIGVPTIDGLDFISAEEIIRCEGMQTCTRIVTRMKSNTVSSYNLGGYIKILEPYGFFSPHKSHLINLRHIVKYKREGSIMMIDGSSVPVSKRRKCEFLKAVTRL